VLVQRLDYAEQKRRFGPGRSDLTVVAIDFSAARAGNCCRVELSQATRFLSARPRGGSQAIIERLQHGCHARDNTRRLPTRFPSGMESGFGQQQRPGSTTSGCRCNLTLPRVDWRAEGRKSCALIGMLRFDQEVA
jgi:hypothetical protein